MSAPHGEPDSQTKGEPNTESGWPRPVVCRGVRGAISVDENTRECLLATTRELLQAIIDANGIHQDDIASVWFTTTPDLTAEYPAIAARQLGWTEVALMCGHEMEVPHGLQMVVRVLIHWNTTLRNNEIRHVYLKEAIRLRPDRGSNGTTADHTQKHLLSESLSISSYPTGTYPNGTYPNGNVDL